MSVNSSTFAKKRESTSPEKMEIGECQHATSTALISVGEWLISVSSSSGLFSSISISIVIFSVLLSFIMQDFSWHGLAHSTSYTYLSLEFPTPSLALFLLFMQRVNCKCLCLCARARTYYLLFFVVFLFKFSIFTVNNFYFLL